MSLRGHNTTDGKFYNLFVLLAKYDVSAAAYLQLMEERGTADKVECNLISPGNQRRLLSCMKQMIKEEIATDIKLQFQ